MQATCGQCMKPYSKKCQQNQPCKIHDKSCFRCRECKQDEDDDVQNCFSCGQICKTQDSFFSKCFNYLCKKQFKTLNLSKDLILLPCGCQQLKQHIVSFLSHYCASCSRKLSQPSPNQIRHCRICLQKSKKNKYLVSENAKNAKSEKQQSQQKTKSFLSDWLNKTKKQKEQKKSQQQAQQNEKLIIKLLNQDFKNVEQQLQISEFTRIELRKELFKSQRDRQCPICTLSYTLILRKPMMICMQQHLICQNCFNTQASLSTCPLCSESIQRDKVRASRERLRTLQLEGIMAEKFDSKKKRFDNICKSNIQQLRYKYEISDIEIQTDFPQARNTILQQPPSATTTNAGLKSLNGSNGRKKIKK